MVLTYVMLYAFAWWLFWLLLKTAFDW